MAPQDRRDPAEGGRDAICPARAGESPPAAALDPAPVISRRDSNRVDELVSLHRDGDRPRLYLAEDSKSQRLYLSAILERDFAVQAFENGQQLLHAAGLALPDLVVADIEMPVLDGLSLTRALKADPRSRPVPGCRWR